MDVCRVLIEEGADARILNNDGKTPAEVIREGYGQEWISDYVKEIEQKQRDTASEFKRARIPEDTDGDEGNEEEEGEEDV